MTTKRVCGGFLALALTGVLTGTALAQTQTPPPTETQLLERAQQNPNDIAALLDLAKLYVEQRRLDEASRTLSQAITSIRRVQFEQAAGAGLTAPLRVGGNVREPKKTKDVAPVYPPIAQAAMVQGYVIAEVIIGPDGRVSDAKVIKSQALLDQAALDAVRQWEYAPPTLNGAPISVIMTVTVIFSLK